VQTVPVVAPGYDLGDTIESGVKQADEIRLALEHGPALFDGLAEVAGHLGDVAHALLAMDKYTPAVEWRAVPARRIELPSADLVEHARTLEAPFIPHPALLETVQSEQGRGTAPVGTSVIRLARGGVGKLFDRRPRSPSAQPRL